jgi:hypothetical protein
MREGIANQGTSRTQQMTLARGNSSVSSGRGCAMDQMSKFPDVRLGSFALG